MHVTGSSRKMSAPAFLAVGVVAVATLLLGGPSAAASAAGGAAATEPAEATAAACHVAAYVDTHNGQVWAAGYVTPPECSPVGDLSAQLDRDNVKVSDGDIYCRGQSTCSVASHSVGLGSGRHRWCARIVFQAWKGNPTEVKWACTYIPA